MKIAIHKNSNSFFEPWETYCERNDIQYKVVDCYEDNIIAQLEDCDSLLWHHNHADPTDVLVAKQLLFALEVKGISVFPDFYSNWHFDDKIAQKYLFEGTGVAHVPTYIFFDRKKALAWIETTTFPKVCKLRGGAGARNVWLVKSKKDAKGLVKKAFGRGFRQYDPWGGIAESWRKFRIGLGTWKDIVKSIAHLVYPIRLEKTKGREKGYIYFQKFIPENTYDIRVIIIAGKAFAIKRNIRPNDFRASGSGSIEYSRELFDIDLIKESFDNAHRLKARCVAFDYVFENNTPLVVEVSYGFNKKGYYDCPGYWTDDLVWHEGVFDPYGWMIEDILKSSHD